MYVLYQSANHLYYPCEIIELYCVRLFSIALYRLLKL